MNKGKFIVFYGVNNLGKSTQAKLLVQKMVDQGYSAKYLKYHIYDLEPSGAIINEYLRNGNPDKLSPREFQLMAVLNKSQYEPKLLRDLDSGVNIIAEDYWGTGVAWGVGAGVEKKFLLRINNSLHREDLAFLFQGQRFTSSIEQNHLHETNRELTDKVAKVHEELADEFGWVKLNANQKIEKVSQEIWEAVKQIL